jgi:hypothetical protein
MIGDPRDDENLVTSQLHLAFRKFHNRLVDYVRAQGLSRIDEVFAEAQRLCRWHYQWMVVHDFLPKMVGQDTVDKILEERSNGPAKVKLSYFKPKNPNKPMMPIEFAAAAYRFGHSMLPHKYEINENNRDVALFDEQDNKNLDGGREIPPDLVIDWRYFFVIPPRVNKARPIDSKLSPPLFELPKRIIPEPDKTLVSLAERNLLRGKRLGLASGQRVAQEMGATVLSNADLFKGLPPDLGNDPGWGGQAPLWFYILKEAQTQQNGVRLGEVGGRIVAEVFLGLLERDKSSYLHPSNKGFRPQAPPRGIAPADGQFGIVDLLKFAGVWTSD